MASRSRTWSATTGRAEARPWPRTAPRLFGWFGGGITGTGRYAVDRFLPVLRAHRPVYGTVAVAVGPVLSMPFLLVAACS
ncbi:hypothetical protein [Streptomyces sp. NPDC000878]